MVYTVTFNPSLDYVVTLAALKIGMVNRTESEKIMAGGKGINVSIVLHNLGIETTALGFVAGFTGDEIEKRVKEQGCVTDFIRLEKGFSRINVKIKEKSESEINGQGPEILGADIDRLFHKIDSIKDGDILVLAGSIPKGMPDDIYMNILERVREKNIRVIVDATGRLLVRVLKYRPFMIKPNTHELEEIFDATISREEEMIEYGRKLRQMGAENVLISRAGEGAILLCGDGKVISSPAIKGEVVNSVGAGDSMVAGFIAGYEEKGDLEYALKMGIATGSASAFSQNLATKEEVAELLERLK